jgi:hypothetical protein
VVVLLHLLRVVLLHPTRTDISSMFSQIWLSIDV